MTYQKSAITGALTGAALALALVAWPVNAKPMDPPPPQWIECVKHGEGECASGGDDTISWADAETDLRIIQDWAARSLHYRARAQTFCRITSCQRRTLKVWTLEEYAALPGVLPLAIYEPGGTWRFTTEFYVEDAKGAGQ